METFYQADGAQSQHKEANNDEKPFAKGTCSHQPQKHNHAPVKKQKLWQVTKYFYMEEWIMWSYVYR